MSGHVIQCFRGIWGWVNCSVSLHQSAEQKSLSTDTLTEYQKPQETRLKSIEEKLGSHYSLLTINRHDKNGYSSSKNYFNLDTIIRAFKNGNLQWLYRILICSLLIMLAFHLLSGITD